MNPDAVHRQNTRRGYQREERAVWRSDEAPFDTAPAPSPPAPDPAAWGRTRDESAEMVRRQMCPVCGEGPWKSPLNHVSRKHGIGRHAMREACGMNMVESVVTAELAEKFAARELTPDRAQALSAMRSPNRRWTTAGRLAVASNVVDVSDDIRRANARLSKTPEAQAKRSATFRAKRDRT